MSRETTTLTAPQVNQLSRAVTSIVDRHQGGMLGQVAPANTTATTLYTPSSGTTAEVRWIIVCNVDSSARTFRIFHDDDGSTFAVGNALYYDTSIAANETTVLIFSIEMNNPAGAIGVRTDLADKLTFTCYGKEFSAT